MPGPRTAQYLVQMTRNLIFHQQDTVFRNGFSTDPSTDGVPILQFLNTALNELLPTGYCKCYFKFATLPGKAEYTIDSGAHEIVHCMINGQVLSNVTLLGQDSRVQGWENYTNALPGTPTRYYTYSDQLGLDPMPDSNYDVFFLADSFPPDLALPDDVPQRLPARFHEALAVRAAWWILSTMDRENETAEKGVPGLLQYWMQAMADLQDVIQHRESDRDDTVQGGYDRQYWARR